MKLTTLTLYWGPILQTGCVIIIAIDLAIDMDVHTIENHFQNLARTFVTPLGDFHMFFFRDGPGRGHRLCKQRDTPKQTRLRKVLLHHFSREAFATRANKEASSFRR